MTIIFMSITTNFSKRTKKESENSKNFHFLDIYVLFLIPSYAATSSDPLSFAASFSVIGIS